MIIDYIENLPAYFSVNPHFKTVYEYLQKSPLEKHETGKYPILKDFINLSVSEYETRKADEARLESHEKNIDIQIIIEGEEKMGIALSAEGLLSEPYNSVRDVAFYQTARDFFTLKKGMFALFYPYDLHMPGIITDHPARVKKAVFKVKV